MNRNLIPTMILLAGLALGGAAHAGDDTGGYRHGGRGGHSASIERTAMNNLLAANLAESTGRDVAEIASLLEKSRPPEVAEQLGLTREAMGQAMQSARATLIERSLAAGMITAAQAESLKAAKPPGRPQGQSSPR